VYAFILYYYILYSSGLSIYTLRGRRSGCEREREGESDREKNVYCARRWRRRCIILCINNKKTGYYIIIIIIIIFLP